jgi:uncharacterized membrane protein
MRDDADARRRPSGLWLEIRSSLWFVPSLLVLASIALGAALVEIDARFAPDLAERWPRLFGAGAEGSRGMLTAVATSMITVAGVTFSITIVALSLASSQFSPRILRNFMRDRRNQVVLGVFLGIFTYCVVVLRTIRGGDEGAFVPSVAVLVGVILGILGIGVLIFFIHHIADAIQASTIIANITAEALDVLERLHPDRLDGAGEDADDGSPAAEHDARSRTVPAPRNGYLRSVDDEKLLAFARRHGVVVHLRPAIGDFLVEGTPLLAWHAAAGGAPAPLDDRTAAAAAGCVDIGNYRTTDQDPGFGLRQLVDIAQKALSPGINDITTAITAVQHVAAILTRAASRRVGAWGAFADGAELVLDRPPTFERLLVGALDPLSAVARGNLAVLTALVDAVRTIGGVTPPGRRHAALRRQLDQLETDGAASLPVPSDRARFEERVLAAREALEVG